MDEFPEVKTDKQQAWEVYREGGGTLDYYSWLDAGMPAITEEQAAFAKLDRLDIYLNAQHDAGNITPSEYDIIIQDAYDQLFGKGKYVGIRKTVTELTGGVWGEAERYWAGLPVAAQKEAEQAAKAEVQRIQDIASQRMQLPLGAGGTQIQQINAGQQAIQNLKTQMQAAPPYLQDEMRSQIAQLEWSIKQIASSVRLQARQTTKAQQPPVEEERQPGMFARQFSEKYGMSPEAAALTGYNYRANPDDPMYASLTSEQKGELAWVGREASGPPPEPEPLPPYNPPEEFARAGEPGSPVWKSWFAQYYPSIVSQFQQQMPAKRTAESWTDFLTKERTRLREQFASQGAYSRAERPGYFQPRVKMVAF